MRKFQVTDKRRPELVAVGPEKKPQLFPTGQVVATPGWIRAAAAAEETGTNYLARHVGGDFGEVCVEDQATNRGAIKAGERILSAYRLSSGVRFWIITEADRSVTTFLLPDEY